jgi:NAD(P) transhydrogenase subunit alpha
MKIVGVPAESAVGERRVALSPKGVARLKKAGFDIVIQSGAGMGANYADQDYVKEGARIVNGAEAVWSSADIITKIKAPALHPALATHETTFLREGQVVVCFAFPGQNTDLLPQFAKAGATLLGMEGVPRISRAQKMDALSSMANIAGYRAVTEASRSFGRFFGGQITAAGRIPPAKVLVIGAGVAGLAAIGAARSLGAIVRAFDTRPAVKDEVKSMGAEFLELEFNEDGTGSGGYAKVMSPEFIAAEMKLFAEQCRDVDIVITTAQIPGKKAPTLITTEMVETMKRGSVVVDLAAEQGGNCELTQPGKYIEHDGIKILGMIDLAARMPNQASEFYSTNVCHLLDHLGGGANFKIDRTDEITRGVLMADVGVILWPPAPPPPAPAKVETATPNVSKTPSPVAPAAAPKNDLGPWIPIGIIAAALFVLIGFVAPADFLGHFTVFVLSCFLGWQVIWNVSAALHTPLMSVTNAISGIIVLGGVVQMIESNPSTLSKVLAVAAVFLASLNIFGGFFVTHRMLKMFRR